MASNNSGTTKASKAWLDNYIANNTTNNNFTRKDNSNLKKAMSDAGLTYNQGQLERRIGKNKDISVGKGLQGKWDQAASNDSITAQLSARGGSSGELMRTPGAPSSEPPAGYDEDRSALFNNAGNMSTHQGEGIATGAGRYIQAPTTTTTTTTPIPDSFEGLTVGQMNKVLSMDSVKTPNATWPVIPDSFEGLTVGQMNAVLSMDSVKTPDPSSSSPIVGPVQQTPKQFINDYLKGVKAGDNTFNIKDKNDLKKSMEENNFDWDRNLVEKQLGNRFKGITVSQKLNNKWNPPATVAEAVGMSTAPGDGSLIRPPGATISEPPDGYDEARTALFNNARNRPAHQREDIAPDAGEYVKAPTPDDPNLNKRQQANMFLDDFISGATADGKFTATDLHDLNAKTTDHTWTDAQLHKRLKKSGAKIGGKISVKLGQVPKEGFDPSKFGLGNRIGGGDVRAWEAQGKSTDYIQGQMDAANASGALKVGKNAQTYLNNQITKAKDLLPTADSGVGTVGGGGGMSAEFDAVETLTDDVDAADAAELQDPNELLNNYSDEQLAGYNLFRGTDAEAGDTTETTQTIDGNDNTTIGGDDNSLTLKPDNSVSAEYTGDIKGNKGMVNIGQGDLFNWASDYDWSSADDNRRFKTTLDVNDYDMDSNDDWETTNLVLGNNNYTDSSVTKITSMGDGPALDNYAATHAYGNLLKKGNKGYGARHANIAKDAINNSPISQIGLGYARGAIMDHIRNNSTASNWNAFGGLMGNDWNIAYDPSKSTEDA